MRANLPSGSYGAPHVSAPSWFGRLAAKTAQLSGRPATFLMATLTIVIWAITGPIFNYSDTWQLVINFNPVGRIVRGYRSGGEDSRRRRGRPRQ